MVAGGVPRSAIRIDFAGQLISGNLNGTRQGDRRANVRNAIQSYFGAVHIAHGDRATIQGRAISRRPSGNVRGSSSVHRNTATAVAAARI
jgi:hypothetical protein